jgi:RNA-directed DNA polymerase
VKDRQAEAEPASVPARAKQAGETRGRWSWVEPSVWTERMLAALEVGVKGGKWYSLIDKVSSLPNLKSAFAKVKRNKGSAGVDRVTIRMYRWPNAFFAEQGLFSFITAYDQIRQSSPR